jgi:tetratricopeptide (TPR) repeat protein
MPYFDGLYVAITGTSGNNSKLQKLVSKYKGKFIVTTPKTHPKIYSKVEGKVIFSNFAEARNVSWSLIDEEYDYISWADVDDVLVAGSEVIEASKLALKKGADLVFFNYWYAVKLDKQGRVVDVVIEHSRERLIKPNKFKWISRLHEVVVPIDGSVEGKGFSWMNGKEGRECKWVHLTEQERVDTAMDRNIAILNIQAKEEDYKDPRTLFYLAKVYFDKEDLEPCKELLNKYLEMSGWDAERANALEYLGLVYSKQENYKEALNCYLEAIKEYPKHHLTHLRIADAYYKLGRDEFADFWLDQAMKMEQPESSTTIGNTEEIKLLAVTLKYVQARRKNDIEGMLEWATRRASLMGKDDGLLEEVKAVKTLNTVAQGTFNLCKYLDNKGDRQAVRQVLEALPSEIGQLPAITYIAGQVGKVKTWSDKSIVYYASFGTQHFEQWDFESADKGGIGGSETAVIRLSEEWQKAGYEVTVYADVDKAITSPSGVEWKPYWQVNWKDKFNIFILWRSPHLIEKVKNAKKLFMDLHDIAGQTQWGDKEMNKIDKVFFKSEYHRRNLPKLPDEKAVVISNGIKI